MARTPKTTDYTVPVDGVGTFTFARRTWTDEIAIQVEYARILDGVPPTPMLDMLANWQSLFKVLMVRAPASWDLDALDPLDPDTFDQLKRLYDEVAKKEVTFRAKPVA